MPRPPDKSPPPEAEAETEAEVEAPPRPHRLLRGLLSVWLLCWGLIIAAFLLAQFDAQPLFRWPVALGWLAVMVGGWVFVFFRLRRLQKLPPRP